MMSLSYGLYILTILLIVPGSYSLERKDFSICDQNSPHIFNHWGFIGLNYQELKLMSRCMLTLKSWQPIYFFVTKKRNSSTCDFRKREYCPCDVGYQDFYCNKMCTPLIFKGNRYRYRYTENSLKSTIFVPSYPNTCQFSVKDVDINICESQKTFLNINLTYITGDVDKSSIFNTYKPVFNTFPNFTMCTVVTRKTVLPLGTKGVIHLSECSGSCSLELTACKHCRIHFYSDNIYEPCLTVKIADTHIKPVAGELAVNFTTASYNVVLHICQYYLDSKHEIYYSVIGNIENITLSSDKDFHISFPLKAEKDEILKYHIESSDPSRLIQIVFPDFLLCSKCSITIQADNSTINRTINNQNRVYRFKSAELIFSSTGINTSRIGFNCSLSLIKDNYPTLIYSTCSEYRKVTSPGKIYFVSSGSYPSYDCVWVLQGRVKLMKVNISSFHLTYNKNIFVHSGASYSGSSLINDLEVHNTEGYNTEMHFMVRALHIRIKGFIKGGSRLHIEYIPGGCTDDDRWFRCPFAQFIPSSQHCNGHNDCSDSSDETDCSNIVGGGCTDADRWFRCPFAQFIPGNKRCDGNRDCSYASDENGCKIWGGRCSDADQWFHCAGQFIPNSKRCNGQIDCQDSSDEKDCNGDRCTDADQWFQCGCQFIPSYQHCDGHPDCKDSSDETDCNNIVGGELFDWKEWFRCPNGRLIRSDLRCNGLSDCPDSSDERDCSNIAEGNNGIFSMGITIAIIIGIVFIVLIICMVYTLYYLRQQKPQVNITERPTHVSNDNSINSTTFIIANDGIDSPAHQEGRRSPPPAYEEIPADSIVQENLNTTFTNPESDPGNAMEMLPTYEKYMEELYDNLPRNITETSNITDNSVHQTNGSSHNQDSNVDDEATRY